MIDSNSSLKAADTIRVLSAAMVEKAQSGHPGGPMGGADYVQVLYSEFLNYNPDDGEWHLRDRFFLDPGHMSAMLYAILGLTGMYTLDELKAFRQWGSPTPGHPEIDRQRGVENTSGPLGLGHAFGAGSAIAERFMAARFGDVVAHKSYIYISDGGVQEEISQGVGRIAGHLGLGNVIMFYDANDVQLSSITSDVSSEDTAKKYEAWHWHVVTIDGNDHDQIRHALQEANDVTDRPSLIIGKTMMGKGARNEKGELIEGAVEFHGKPLGNSNASFEETLRGLGADPSDGFSIDEEISGYFDDINSHKRDMVSRRNQEFDSWAMHNPDSAEKYWKFHHDDLGNIPWDTLDQKLDQATRNSSSAVLAFLADHLDNLIVSSADLSNSDKTDGFLKKTSIFRKGDFSGAFLQAGVSELTMAALSTGMALHGGVIPICATFFAFSDYMKPVLRVCALMEQQVIFVWTHDAFRVGEDGPTHQPIEQEAQLRLLEQLRNHSGRSSLLALRPADGEETTAAWRLAIQNQAGPTGLIFSRQNIKSLPVRSHQAVFESVAHGAYIVQEDSSEPDIVLVANGSEVASLIEAAELLSMCDGINTRIVSVPSEGLFRSQESSYQEKIIPADKKVFGLTAGLPVSLRGLVGHQGYVWGLQHFGQSAPYHVLDEKFGFTADAVASRIKEFLA